MIIHKTIFGQHIEAAKLKPANFGGQYSAVKMGDLGNEIFVSYRGETNKIIKVPFNSQDVLIPHPLNSSTGDMTM